VNLGWVAVARGELAEAERHFADGLALQRALGERRSCAYTASYLGLVAQRRGDVRGAVAWYDESLALGEPLDDPILTTVTRVRLVAARHEAAVPDPEPDALEARLLPAFREIGHPWSLSFALAQLGVARRDAGELAGARAALEESLALRRGMGDRLSAAESRALLADVAWRAGDRAAAAAGWHEALRERHAAGQRLGVAECAEGLAAVALGDGDAATAARLLGFAAAARSRLGAPVPARYRAEHAARDAAAGRALGAEGARAARDEGAALDADAAVALALRVGA
jgi:tetratricopeptide (TPR) repeat protein